MKRVCAMNERKTVGVVDEVGEREENRGEETESWRR